MNHFADSIGAIDQVAFALINGTLRHVLLDLLMPVVTDKWSFVVPAACVALYMITKGGRRGRWVLLCAVLLVVAADASSTALRGHFERVRPCQALQGVQLLVGCSDSFSFPSTHATNAFALAAFFACYYRTLVMPLFVFAALVGYSRIYVGVHYPVDVLGGACLGTTLGLTVGTGSRWLWQKWSSAARLAAGAADAP